MGTRADFYVGTGEKAEWLGSVAYDGYPSNGDYHAIFKAKTEKRYRKLVAELLANRDDATTPDKGWPWPWKDSRTTDYAYTFKRTRVYGSYFGHKLAPMLTRKKGKLVVRDELPYNDNEEKEAVWPQFSTDKFAPAGTQRSGVMVAKF